MHAASRTLFLRAVLSAVALTFLYGTVALSQCGPGGCPIGPRQPGISMPRQPIVSAPHPGVPYDADGLPETINRKTLVHIFSYMGRMRGAGTGAIVRYKEEKYIVTAAHVVSGAATVMVKGHDGRTAEAAVLAADRTYDVGVLGLPSSFGDLPVIELADRHPQPGEVLQSAGFGTRDWPGWRNGQFQGWRQPPGGENADWFVLGVPAEPGDSGGPIVNRDGKLVGILWGTDGQHTVGTQVGRIARVLETCFLRRRPRVETPQPQPPQGAPSMPPEVKPEPKPEPPKVEEPKPEPPKAETKQAISLWWILAPSGFLALFMLSALISQFSYRLFSKQPNA